jgi:hypothetical protein
MANDDARSLDHKTLEALRIRAVRSVQAGESPSAVARALGVTARTMKRPARHAWLPRDEWRSDHSRTMRVMPGGLTQAVSLDGRVNPRIKSGDGHDGGAAQLKAAERMAIFRVNRALRGSSLTTGQESGDRYG